MSRTFRLMLLMILAVSIVAIGLGSGPVQADPTYAFYKVFNTDPRFGDGLELTFNSKIQVDNKGDPKGSLSVKFNTQSVLAGSAGKGIDFRDGVVAANTGFDTGVVALDPGATKLTKAEFHHNIGNNSTIAKPDVTVKVGKKDNGFIEITNDEPTLPVFFTSVKASTDIPSSFFINPSTSQLMADIDNELYAVGSQPDFFLLPGQTKQIELGLDTGNNYTAAVFTMDFTSEPSSFATRLGFASNEELVPEPASIMLLGIGIAGLLGARVRRKLRQAGPAPSSAPG